MEGQTCQKVQRLFQRQIDEDFEIDQQISMHEQRDLEIRMSEVEQMQLVDNSYVHVPQKLIMYM